MNGSEPLRWEIIKQYELTPKDHSHKISLHTIFCCDLSADSLISLSTNSSPLGGVSHNQSPADTHILLTRWIDVCVWPTQCFTDISSWVS